jgi:phenylpyruvate tautomerase PptA (4-oxalocrotonate tautomerase family)
MPFLNIVTNSKINDESALIKAASQTVSQASGKPETYVMVTVQSQNMSMSGEQGPTAFLDYRSLGLPSDRTAFSDALCTMINEQLGIQGDRIYIGMTDSARQDWGWNHGTF